MPKKRFSAEQFVVLLRQIEVLTSQGQGCARSMPRGRHIAAELRDECLNQEIFFSLKEAQIFIEQWRNHEIIIKYNGMLERYAGDGVMVVFNDPVPVEYPALQAVFMALEVREAIGALTETWRHFGHDIGFGIAIAHGFATLGTIGFRGPLRLRRHWHRIQRRLSTVR